MTSVTAPEIFQCLAMTDSHGGEEAKFLVEEQVTG